MGINLTPDFVEVADELFPGIADEYAVLDRLSLFLLASRKSAGLERTVLLQCGIAWQHYHAVLLLIANKYGIQSLIVCRTLFESVVCTLYLMENPGLLPDFLDFGKLTLYQQALDANLPARQLSAVQKECEAIRARFQKARGRGKTWHGSTIKEMAKAVRLDVFYKRLYTYASAAAHSDATKTIRHRPRGWVHNLSQFSDEHESDFVRYVSFQLISHLFFKASKALDIGHDLEANAVRLLQLSRAKSAAMPN